MKGLFRSRAIHMVLLTLLILLLQPSPQPEALLQDARMQLEASTPDEETLTNTAVSLLQMYPDWPQPARLAV